MTVKAKTMVVQESPAMAIPVRGSSTSLSPRASPTFCDCLQVVPETDSDSASGDLDGRTSRADTLGSEKDSGVENLDDDFPVPDAELLQKIVAQVESYFLDESLEKDAFLLKHIRRNKEGFVSLKLVASFRKVKALTKNWKVVTHCITVGSQKLIINDTLTKVRRVAPLPEHIRFGERTLKNSDCRMLVAYALPCPKPTVSSASHLFASYGEMSSVQLLRTPLPSSLTPFAATHPDMVKGAVVMVEFESSLAAQAAVRQIEAASLGNWRRPMRAFLLEDVSSKPANREGRANTIATDSPSGTRSMAVGSPMSLNQRSRAQSTMEVHSRLQRPPTRAEGPLCQRPRIKSNSLSVSPRSSRLSSCDSDLSTSPSYERIHRVDNLLRQPKGPDGTRGFARPDLKSRSFSLSSGSL